MTLDIIKTTVNDQQPQLIHQGFCHMHTLPINLSLCQPLPFFFPLFPPFSYGSHSACCLETRVFYSSINFDIQDTRVKQKTTRGQNKLIQ